MKVRSSAPSVKNCKTLTRPLTAEGFAKAVVAALAPVADPTLCVGMRAYMKDQFEFLGVKTPVRRAAVAGLIRAQKNATANDLLRCARRLWAMPEREYQYVAIDLLARQAGTLTPEDLPPLFALVRKKSWWDTVDALAGVIGRVVRAACEDDPAMQCSMDEALSSDNLWTRRVAIIHQLGWRSKTDTKRLFSYASTCAHERDFFIRKAIGWALRDYARHAPTEVRAFLHANRKNLSPLSLREAAKHL